MLTEKKGLLTGYLMKKFEDIDFYTDTSIIDDPHPYFDYLRTQGPVHRLKNRNVVAVTGFSEAIKISLDTEHFSSDNSVIGPFFDLPFKVTSGLMAARVYCALTRGLKKSQSAMSGRSS